MYDLVKIDGPNILLTRILLIRILVISFAILTHFVSLNFLDLGLKTSILSLLLIYGIISAIYIGFRVRSKVPIKEREVLSHLIADAIFLTFILFHSGGAVNPFVSYYLVLLAICATALEKKRVWSLVLVTIAGYSYLMVNSSLHSHGDQGVFAWHLWGMWLNFLLMAVLIGFFVSRMGESLRQNQMLLTRERENALRNEQIVAVGNMAAGTAHELGTPLSTMSVVLKELENDCKDGKNLECKDDIVLLQEQVGVCKERLKTFSKLANSHFEKLHPVQVTEFMENLLDQWRVVRPDAEYNFFCRQENSPFIIPDYTLRHALMNLLNNAVDASQSAIDIILRWDDENIFIRIDDKGPGMSKDALNSLGHLFYSSKSGGMGLGFFLANATIERMGGKIKILENKTILSTDIQKPEDKNIRKDRKKTGTSIEICLPQWSKMNDRQTR